MTETLIIGVLCVAFGGLTTYFITSVASRGQIEHKIADHQDRCPAVLQIDRIDAKLDNVKTAVTFLVSKNGGNPRDLGLVE